MEECRKLRAMRCYDNLFRHCCLPGSFHFPFIIFRALILDIFYSVSVISGMDMAKFETALMHLQKVSQTAQADVAETFCCL